MSNLNYYEVLGLKPTCTSHEIKKSYRQLALIWHPDKHNNKEEAEIQFTSINEAYTILNDTEKRQIYDTYGHKGLQSRQDGFDKPNKKNFCQKGFYGTDKSAFDVLNDIFMDKDDDNFFESCNISSMYSNMKSNIESMVFEQFVSSEGEGNNFFKDYVPTFMNTAFSSLNGIFTTEQDSSPFFSSFFASAFESESGSKDKKNSKKTQKKSKNCNIGFIEEKDCQPKNSAKFSSSLNKQKTKPLEPRMSRKGSFLTNNGDETIEEDFYMEIKIVDHKIESYFEDIIEDNTYDIRPRKKYSERFSRKNNCREELLHESRKKVKK